VSSEPEGQKGRPWLETERFLPPSRRTSPEAGDYIICPNCAEPVRAAAKKCRFCGHVLNGNQREKDEWKRGLVALAAVLLVVAGGLFGYTQWQQDLARDWCAENSSRVGTTAMVLDVDIRVPGGWERACYQAYEWR